MYSLGILKLQRSVYFIYRKFYKTIIRSRFVKRCNKYESHLFRTKGTHQTRYVTSKL